MHRGAFRLEPRYRRGAGKAELTVPCQRQVLMERAEVERSGGKSAALIIEFEELEAIPGREGR